MTPLEIIQAQNDMIFEAVKNSDKEVEKDHDCHASPEDGCAGCPAKD